MVNSLAVFPLGGTVVVPRTRGRRGKSVVASYARACVAAVIVVLLPVSGS